MLIVLVFSIVASAAPQCSFRDGDINARWQVSDDELTIEIVNKNIGDNQWTGIGFGPSMNDLEVVLVKIENNKPTLLTGFTSSYGPPTLDSTANVVPSLLSFNSSGTGENREQRGKEEKTREVVKESREFQAISLGCASLVPYPRMERGATVWKDAINGMWVILLAWEALSENSDQMQSFFKKDKVTKA
uniref:DOMON domain-containing protein n=1 Tax=Angiostrongylus cantonensis TaxID=6313 RepID=A0A0K0CZ95_ANGCA